MTAQQLKNSILLMAVQGKLVPQDPNDEPASVLLERIHAEKERLIKEKKIKREKNPSVIFKGADNTPYEKIGDDEPVSIADEVPFDIPDTWEWARLKELVTKEIKRGKSPKYADHGSVLVFAQKCNVKLGGIDISLAKYLDMSTFPKYPAEEHMIDEDIIINSTGNGTLGRIGMFHDSDRINDYVIVPDSHVTIIRSTSLLQREYLFHVLKYYQPYIEKQGEGSTNQTELRPSTVAELFIPIPPADEQKRIIAKLLDLLPLVKVYGEKEVALEKYNSEFPDQLKKSILQIAVQGKLVPQDPADEPASLLLDHIRLEKKSLAKRGIIKKEKNESVIFRRDNSHYEKLDGVERCIDDELPFEIPDSWVWVRLGTVLEIARGGSPRPIQQYLTTEPDGINWIKIGDTDKGGKYIYKTKEKIRPEGVTKSRMVHSGDFLLTNSMSFGRPYILKTDGCIHDGWLVLSNRFDCYSVDFLYYILSSPFAYYQFCDSVSGAVVKNLNSDKVSNALFPLPPLNEQRRIVQRIEELFPLVKGL